MFKRFFKKSDIIEDIDSIILARPSFISVMISGVKFLPKAFKIIFTFSFE